MRWRRYRPWAGPDCIPGSLFGALDERERRARQNSTATIDRERRDALYELVLDHLSGLGDFWIAIEAGSIGLAERSGGIGASLLICVTHLRCFSEGQVPYLNISSKL